MRAVKLLSWALFFIFSVEVIAEILSPPTYNGNGFLSLTNQESTLIQTEHYSKSALINSYSNYLTNTFYNKSTSAFRASNDYKVFNAFLSNTNSGFPGSTSYPNYWKYPNTNSQAPYYYPSYPYGYVNFNPMIGKYIINQDHHQIKFDPNFKPEDYRNFHPFEIQAAFMRMIENHRLRQACEFLHQPITEIAGTTAPKILSPGQYIQLINPALPYNGTTNPSKYSRSSPTYVSYYYYPSYDYKTSYPNYKHTYPWVSNPQVNDEPRFISRGTHTSYFDGYLYPRYIKVLNCQTIMNN